MPNPKRSTESIAKLTGGGNTAAYTHNKQALPSAQHRVTNSVSDTPAPAHLRPRTKRNWDSIVATSEWLAPSDLIALEYLCELMDRRDRITEDFLVTGKAPSATINQLERLILSAMNDLGLTPKARIQLGLAVVETENALEQFLKASGQ